MFKEDETRYCKECYKYAEKAKYWKDLAQHNGRVCNERLDKIDELEHDNNELQGQLNLYKQTLTYIKEIAENAKTKVFVDMEEFWKQILQKISEVEALND